MAKAKIRKNFHQASWDEPMIYEMSTPGTRGIIPPEVEEGIVSEVGNIAAQLPASIARKQAPSLPEVDQKHVLQHWIHLSQETMGSNLSNDMSEGTCTMKYNPRICETIAQDPGFADVHPDQPDETVQGILEIYHEFEKVVKEVSGMDHFTLQPGGGNHAVYAAASIVRAYHEANGEADQRDEVITTIFSHPCDAATPATAGYKIITIYPDERGIPDLEAIRAATSERTAAIFMTNPEDIGIYNPNVLEITKIIHDVGGLCFYDQANANAFLGVARAREAGFDMCHFNVHKTFGTPHGGSGPATGAFGCKEHLAKYLPVPSVEYDGSKYYLDYDHPDSIGKIRDFMGTAGVVLRAYAWTRMMGEAGLRECADVSVINNNYLQKKMESIPGVTSAFQGNGIVRQEQIRYSFENLHDETGVGTEDIARRAVDFGIPWYWTSHHPWVIPEPMTLEPCETYSKADMDEYYEVIKTIAGEARKDPEMVKGAPYRSVIHKIKNMAELDDPDQWALTWRAYLRKHGK
ncbi:MAG: aminomethyl-transferring glycine dehydrogenase subunit GcvPB [Christensenella sp.]|uniref:aminomethyl-transferring glycine dehydrogenase subunit GcvPB n=1 Tax=Christensenella sp. TaxID=1935934 RepID=UPI002B21C9AC|nr:aminomethyl-transferring glycine dehydrogenase subunit GcvPB [Christensenella sp.]MEA5003281.1 aminomethyl-transferring glycine dehydrogenase subunit GcvPB [Christensenella sp.]